MLGERLTNLLSLLSQDEYQTADQLAGKMGVSSKTLRQFIYQLDEILLENGAHILTKWGQGYQLQVENFDRFQALFVQTEDNSLTSSQVRISYLLDYFLNHKDYIKADEMCDMLYVCKKTLAADLKKMEQMLKEYDLTLERKPYHGMRVTGNEFQIRLCLAKCRDNSSMTQELLNQEEQRRIYECLVRCMEHRNYRISDIAFQSLIIHIHVAIKRIQSGQYIPLMEDDYQKWTEREEYGLAKTCAKQLEQLFEISFPKEEITYIAIHLAGKGHGNDFSTNTGNLIISSEVHEIVNEMLEEIYQVFRIDLRDDLELVMALGQHLIPLDVRLRFGMKLNNPLLGEIKERYSLAYVMAVQACAVLGRHYKKLIDLNEIAYIALALALTMERQRTHIKKKTILLVCASGAGTAKLLAYKMQDTFHDCIKDIIMCDERNVEKQDFSRIDYIFTTVPIRTKVPVPICEVKFFMSISDIKEMRRILILGEKKDITANYPKDLFFTGISLDTKEEVIRYLCDRIAEKRKLPDGFFQAIMKREQLALTYMGNMAAMPHPCQVMTEDTFVTVGILDRPIEWNENQLVQVVLLVSVSKKKKKKIQDFYMVLARLILGKEYMEELIRKKDHETLCLLIEQVTEQLEGR